MRILLVQEIPESGAVIRRYSDGCVVAFVWDRLVYRNNRGTVECARRVVRDVLAPRPKVQA